MHSTAIYFYFLIFHQFQQQLVIATRMKGLVKNIAINLFVSREYLFFS